MADGETRLACLIVNNVSGQESKIDVLIPVLSHLLTTWHAAEKMINEKLVLGRCILGC